MKRKIKNYLFMLATAAVLFGGMRMPLVVKAQEGEVTVSSREEFMTALEQKKSTIIVDNLVTIGDQAEGSGRMQPVIIPAGTLIQGTGSGDLNARCPIQLGGDNVCFKDIKLTFESSDALGSVPHREIFLAGHSLTMDNVNTYLKGSGGSLGSLGGSEKELLPTVYAGGYPNSTIGSNASLTVINSNEETMFKAIYMGHEAGGDNNVPYKADAVLNLDAKATVREGIYTSYNNRAEINIKGETSQSARIKQIYGNENTNFTLQNLSMEEAEINEVGNIVLKDGAYLSPKTDIDMLYNVTLQNGSCLDLNNLKYTEIFENFKGEEQGGSARGILVLNPEGTLRIDGQITGTTQFQTESKHFPGTLLPEHIYISAFSDKCMESNFVLAQKSIENGFELNYLNGTWLTNPKDLKEIGRIEILSAPSKVDLAKISLYDEEEISEGDPYFEVKWYDKEGNVFDDNEIEDGRFYESDQVLCIRTEYWESEAPDVLSKTDWLQPVTFMPLEGYPGRYYLQKYDDVTTGDYTFLFLSSYCEGDLITVAEVKALKDTVKAEQRVTFYNGDTGETEKPEPEKPEHTHSYQSTVTKEATCTEKGIRTYTCSCGNKYTEELAVLSHKYIVKVSPATVKNNGKIQQSCQVCSAAGSASVIYKPRKLTLNKTDFSYDGKVKTPSVTVKDSQGNSLKKGTDYQIKYPKGRKNPGVYSVAIVLQGNYSGKMTGSFTIRPKKTSLKKIAAKSKGMQVTWNKQAAQIDGYQIQYCTSAKFKGKTLKAVTVKKNSTVKKISKLAGKKKYYVRIRTYKTVKVNGKSKKLYSDWSGKKAVNTKK